DPLKPCARAEHLRQVKPGSDSGMAVWFRTLNCLKNVSPWPSLSSSENKKQLSLKVLKSKEMRLESTL
ncbi:hypothetical protein Dimus_016332, partial [Dionaea muscipula]